MKFVLMLALLVGVARCHHLQRRGDHHDDHQEAEESSFYKQGSKLSPGSISAKVLPTTYEVLDLDDDIPDLPSAFHKKGSKLSPESAVSRILPSAYEKVDI